MAVTNFQLTPLDPGRSFLQGQAMGQEMRSNKLRDLVMQQQAEQNQRIGDLKIAGMERDNQMAEFTQNLTGVGLIGAALKEARPETPEQAAQVFNLMKGQLGEAGYDVSDLGEFDPQQMPKYAAAYSAARAANLLRSDSDLIPAGLREFAGLADQANLSPEERRTAARVEMGLIPRAVGSADQTIAAQGNAEQVGDSKAVIEDRVTRAKKDAENATGQVKEYFTQLGNIEANIANYNEAISLIDQGAGTGVIQRRLPSVRAASQKLDNVQKRLGLDVIGNTTFGALSEQELAFAVDSALPTNLEGAELREWLTKKRDAQQKLADYIDGAIQFLSVPGNSLADLQSASPRQNARSENPQPDPPQTAQAGQPPMQGARQAPDGNWYVEQNGQFFRVEP